MNFDNAASTEISALARWLQNGDDSPINARLLSLNHPSLHPTAHSTDGLSQDAQKASRMCEEVFGMFDKPEPSLVGNMARDLTLKSSAAGSSALSSTSSPVDDDSDGTSVSSMPSLSAATSVTDDTIATNEVLPYNLAQNAVATHGHAADPDADLPPQQRPVNHHPVLETDQHLQCPFFFLDCTFQSCDARTWKVHCQSHLKNCTPPAAVRCTCCNLQCDGWQHYLRHVVEAHRGQLLSTQEPDGEFVVHLRQKGAITMAEYQVIIEAGHVRGKHPNFSIPHDKKLEERRLANKDLPSRSRYLQESMHRYYAQ